jgi:hypothetical protein
MIGCLLARQKKQREEAHLGHAFQRIVDEREMHVHAPTVVLPPFEAQDLQRAVTVRSNNSGGTPLVPYGGVAAKPVVPGMTSGWQREIEIRGVSPTQERSYGKWSSS